MAITERSAGSAATPAFGSYQVVLVALLSLNFGILFFDRNALNFVMPFVKPELGLTNTQVGLTSSALSFAWALAALFIGARADRSGRRKAYLVGATIAFSLCSFLSGLATTFALLLGSRLLMGVADGGIAPISQSLTALSVTPERRGLAMGIMQNFGSNLLGSFAAPVLLVSFAAAYGWHQAFYLAGVPGLICAFLLWRVVREPETAVEESTTAAPLLDRLREILRHRNMVLCSVIAVLLVSYLVICWAFMPLYLTQVRGMEPATMSWLMGSLGISATVGSFVVSGISDAIGRRPVLICASLLGVVLPLGAMYYHGSVWILATLFFIGWGLNGTFPLFMGTIPSESVSRTQMTTAIALVMGAGEVFGGVLAPTIAGRVADGAGLSAPLWIMLALCIVAGLLAFGLLETAPRRVRTVLAGSGSGSGSQ